LGGDLEGEFFEFDAGVVEDEAGIEGGEGGEARVVF